MTKKENAASRKKSEAPYVNQAIGNAVAERSGYEQVTADFYCEVPDVSEDFHEDQDTRGSGDSQFYEIPISAMQMNHRDVIYENP